MIIQKLILNNFRVFSGEVVIDLEPEHSHVSNKPVILFGGLNGAGKTSILTGVRLAIFGKRAFGQNITSKDYKAILMDLSHKSNDGLTEEDSFVELAFTYVKLGDLYEYRIRRSWSHSQCEEELLIYENGYALTELSNDQAQSFLFDLIPIGVADLFFFDGEKIKELAEEDDNRILADALKKMIGVDFVERGIADLSIILRSKNKDSADINAQSQIQKLETDLENLESSIASQQDNIQQVITALTAEEIELERMEQKLREEGGDWVVSRDDLIKQQSEFEYRKKQLATKCLDEFKGNFPFTVAPIFMEKLYEEVVKSRKNTVNLAFNDQLRSKQNILALHLNIKSSELQVQALIEDLSEPVEFSQLDFVAPKTVDKFERLVSTKVKDKNALKNFLLEIEEIDFSLDNLGKNLARVPDQEALKVYFTEMHDKKLIVESLKAELELEKGGCRTKVQQAIEITKVLEKISAQIKINSKDLSVVKFATSAISAMQQLMIRLTEIKVEEIEKYFYDSFKRMARKDDMDLSVKIKPSNFDVQLISDKGIFFDKKRLSAGEKQIYALAMLEALGKASGRSLPFIIDTPLGRLDSLHRQKIVKEFFPKVNDQVIILSTDTEVDEAFFRDLEPSIAKSYELLYDSKSGSSHVSPGYFWRGQ